MGKRIILIQVLLFSAIVLLAAKAVEIQVFKAPVLSQKAEREYLGYTVMKGKRGKIFDAHMNALATSGDSLSLAASPAQIKDPARTAAKLAHALDISEKKLEKALSKKRSFTWVKRHLTSHEIEKVSRLSMKGIHFREDVRRHYPNESLAAQVIGFKGTDKGLEGLEYEYDRILKGKQLKVKITKDATGRLLDSEKRLADKFSGDSLVLTIDRKIQFLTERALKRAVDHQNADSGIAIVMEPDTGYIRAIAHCPQFNPNRFLDYDNAIWRNRAVTDQFEPGSVMKIFTAATAVENNICKPKSIFYCENGAYEIGSFTVNDIHPHGWLTLRQIIKFSSNIGAIKISETIDHKIFYNSLNKFGFGNKTGIEYPGETTGRLIPYYDWSEIDRGAIAFGQGIAVSAIQLAAGVAAIANDGILMKPVLVEKIVSPDGKVRKINHPVPVRRVISKGTAVTIKNIMRSVVTEEGTGSKAVMNGYSVCGKTGTAQKAATDGTGYSKNRFTAVFTGFAPEKHPEFVILVIVDEPGKNHYGGVVAAPVFKNIMLESFNYLGIPPDNVNSHSLLANAAMRGL